LPISRIADAPGRGDGANSDSLLNDVDLEKQLPAHHQHHRMKRVCENVLECGIFRDPQGGFPEDGDGGRGGGLWAFAQAVAF